MNFQLSWFAFDYNFEENVKIYDYFEFFEEIDLSKYTINQEDAIYELLAVYVHIGLRGNSGHYKLFMKLG